MILQVLFSLIFIATSESQAAYKECSVAYGKVLESCGAKASPVIGSDGCSKNVHLCKTQCEVLPSDSLAQRHLADCLKFQPVSPGQAAVIESLNQLSKEEHDKAEQFKAGPGGSSGGALSGIEATIAPDKIRAGFKMQIGVPPPPKSLDPLSPPASR